MSRLTIVLWALGALAVAALVAWTDVGSVAHAVASVGWGAALVVLLRAATVFAAGLAWHVLFPAGLQPRLSACLRIRFVREAINTLLPFAQVGGELIGARLLTFFRVDGATAGASVIVDLMVQAGTQLLFAILGLAVLIALGGDETVVRVVSIGLALATPALLGFYFAQRSGGRRLAQAALRRLAGGREWRALGAVEALFDRLHTFYADRAALARGTAVHLAIWFIGVAETWVALAFMGHPVGFAEALVIESLAQAVRSAAFVVPGALGVQEGGLIALGAIFGIPAEAALALSFLKRAADLVVGAPGLLVWQALEGRRFRGRREPAGLGAVAAKNGDPLA